MIQRLYLIARELGGNRLISLVVLLSVVLSVFSVGLYRAVGNGLTTYVNDRFASAIPPHMVKVSTRQPRSGFLFEIEREPAPGISDSVMRRIRRMEGVATIQAVAALGVPLQARVSYLGFKYRSDILAFGAPYELVRDEIREPRYQRLWKDPKPGSAVPVLVPRNMLRSYNDGMAAPNKLPRISERGALGFGFRMLVGKSSLRTLEGFVETDAVIAGFTDRVDSFALILPLGLVTAYNREFDPGMKNTYQYAYVRVRDHAAMNSVTSVIERMGLVVEAEKGVSRQIMRLREAIALITASLQSIIMIIALIAISFATLIATMSRVEYYRTLRVVGASRIFLTVTILVKCAFLGVVGSWAGVELLDFVSGRALEYLRLSGIMVPGALPEGIRERMIALGVIIPVVSAIPAIARLHFKGLSGD